MKRLYWTLITLIVLVNCANRGRPEGGPVDEDPPVIIRSTPENYTTNFTATEIRIDFDEFIKIKDLQKQLIISPPMKWEPEIVPQGSASKYIRIRIKDTLPPNTTYAFNFGNSIVDNNEENPFPYFRYVFSTGPTIDSLSVQGIVLDALEREPDTYISVMLYEQDSTYTDSIVYKNRPKYITNTLDSIKIFSIDNLKAGTYKLVAMKDKNSNYLFDPKDDKIGFVEGFIEVPKDTLYRLKLFKEILPFKASRPKQEAQTRIMFPYEGELGDFNIEMLDSLPSDFEYTITKDVTADSLYYWYKPKLERDSTLFKFTNDITVDTLKHRFRTIEADSFEIEALTRGKIDFDQSFTISNVTPFKTIDTTLISIIDKDSIPVTFGVVLDTLMNRYEFPIDLKEGQTYNMTLYPGAITDFYGSTNDTLNYRFGSKAKSDYGNMRLDIKNGQIPMIVQLVDEQGRVRYEKRARLTSVVDFIDVLPGSYFQRVIFDTNNNGIWDTGNFLLGIQPERVIYFISEDPQVRANFDYFEVLTVLDETGPDPPEN